MKLLAVDWFKSNNKVQKVAVHPQCVVQSEVGKSLPFLLVINLQVPSFRQIGHCLNSSHFQVAECALFLLTNDYIINLMSQHRYEVGNFSDEE